MGLVAGVRSGDRDNNCNGEAGNARGAGAVRGRTQLLGKWPGHMTQELKGRIWLWASGCWRRLSSEHRIQGNNRQTRNKALVSARLKSQKTQLRRVWREGMGVSGTGIDCRLGVVIPVDRDGIRLNPALWQCENCHQNS